MAYSKTLFRAMAIVLFAAFLCFDAVPVEGAKNRVIVKGRRSTEKPGSDQRLGLGLKFGNGQNLGFGLNLGYGKNPSNGKKPNRENTWNVGVDLEVDAKGLLNSAVKHFGGDFKESVDSIKESVDSIQESVDLVQENEICTDSSRNWMDKGLDFLIENGASFIGEVGDCFTNTQKAFFVVGLLLVLLIGIGPLCCCICCLRCFCC